MKVVATLKKRADEERATGEAPSDTGLRDITQRLLVGLIENEINAAFIFVAVARAAYLAAELSDGNGARSKAEAICARASELAQDTHGKPHQAIADHLRELRRAIDALMTGKVAK